MGATKEYYLKLSEEHYEGLDPNEKLYLNQLGLKVKQLPTEEDLKDENYKKIRNESLKYYNAEQEYLFKKRNK